MGLRPRDRKAYNGIGKALLQKITKISTENCVGTLSPWRETMHHFSTHIAKKGATKRHGRVANKLLHVGIVIRPHFTANWGMMKHTSPKNAEQLPKSPNDHRGQSPQEIRIENVIQQNRQTRPTIV
jgi:hypothetical protein